jgi:hypothetical protein
MIPPIYAAIAVAYVRPLKNKKLAVSHQLKF